MAGWAELQPGTRGAIIAGAVAVLVALGGLGFQFGSRGTAPAPAPEAGGVAPAAPAATVSAPGADAPTTAVTDPAAVPAADLAETRDGAAPDPGLAAAPVGTESEGSATAGAPSFDVVRVTPEGRATVAGRAAEGSTVALVIDGTVAAMAEAGAGGRFALLFDLPLSDTPRLLTLEELRADGSIIAGGQSVILAPGRALAGAGAEAGPDTPAAGTPVAAATEPAEAAAPLVILAEQAGVRVLQPGAGASASVEGIVVEAISSDGGGRMAISGRAEGSGHARVYADNVEIGIVRITERGWRAELPADAPARFTLRVDQIGPSGEVVARAETEITRETREELGGLLVEELRAGEVGAVIVTVQRGFTLWRIARENYGEGILYVKVFEANRDQIRDPDLIYPGQVFTVPLDRPGEAPG